MENFNISFPIDFIKKEQRVVVGIATADNVDKAGDIVDFNASLEAFKAWSGNIREMHSPIAVGKAIKYEPIQVKDPDGNMFNAIRVEAYISKGAQDTWEKVLDGTLRSFSIGGKILEKQDDAKKMFNGRPVSVIKKYVLGELSLVDNPANAIAVIDIVKRDDYGNLNYILRDLEKAGELKDPKGGLTAAGRRHFKETEGANLKPGVKGPANTPEKMRRKGSFLTRFFTNPSGPMKDAKGNSTRLALSAAAWGEPVPQDRSDAAALAAKGRRLLERYANTKNVNKGEGAMDYMSVDKEVTNAVLSELMVYLHELFAANGIAMPDVSTDESDGQEMDEDQESEMDLTPEMIDETSEDMITEEEVPELEDEAMDSTEEPVLSPEELILRISQLLGKTEDFNIENDNDIFNRDTIKDMDVVKMQADSLQDNINYDTIFNMVGQDQVKLSLVKRFMTWLVPSTQEVASTIEMVEVAKNIQEEDMDIEVLKNALSAVVDQKLEDFATSIKNDVEASLQSKIEDITKSFEAQTAELEGKLEASESALAAQEIEFKSLAKSGASKKSIDPEDDDEELAKSAEPSFWDNVFMPQSTLDALSFRS